MKPETSPDYNDGCFNKEADEQIKNAGNIYCRLIENADGITYHLIFGAGLREGTYLNAGNSIKELFGIKSGEFTEELFQSMIEEIIPLGQDITVNPVETREKIINGAIQKYKAEILVTTPGGEKKWIRDTALPVVDDKTGKVIGLIGILFDVTGYKMALRQLEKANERATESDRLKTSFLNNLSHEIRTPLNAIVGFTTLLGESGIAVGNRMDFMDIITHSSDHLLEIVDDILEISKIEAKIVRVIKKEINLNEMLRRVYERFSPAAEEKNILLRYDGMIDKQEIIIITDGYKLFQSLNNLVGNAVKFTNKGMVEFGCSVKEENIEFFVFDTGIGIKEEHQPNIFDPFFQAESGSTQRYDGTGLGLSIAKAYIELLGGRIWFNSEPGEGSVFCFNIPDTRNIRG